MGMEMNERIRERLKAAANSLKERIAKESKCPDEVKAEAIAACDVVLEDLLGRRNLPVNPYYAAYESTPEVVFSEHFEERFFDLCPIGVKYNEEQRKIREEEERLREEEESNGMSGPSM